MGIGDGGASAGEAAGDVYLDGATPAVPAGRCSCCATGHLGRVPGDQGRDHVVAARRRDQRPGDTGARRIRPTGLSSFSIRRTTAYAAPGAVRLADVPAPETLDRSTIELDGLMLGLRKDRPVVLAGEPVADRGHPVARAHQLDDGRPRLRPGPLDDGHAGRWRLGRAGRIDDDDPRQRRPRQPGRDPPRGARQRRQPAVLPVVRPAPAAADLSQRANPRRACRARCRSGSTRCSGRPSTRFEGAGPDDRVYVVRDQDGKTVVQFGDGITGARLPTGPPTCARCTAPAAVCRGTGAGRPADAADVALRRRHRGDQPAPVGRRRRSRDGRLRARQRTAAGDDLDRVVSLADYALFARAFPGVAKAQAVWARAANHRGAADHRGRQSGGTVLSSAGVSASTCWPRSSKLGDPLVPVALVAACARSFRLAASVRTDPDRAARTCSPPCRPG